MLWPSRRKVMEEAAEANNADVTEEKHNNPGFVPAE